MSVVGAGTKRQGTFHVVDALNTEWTLLVETRSSSVLGWVRRHPALLGCASLADVLQLAQDHSDPVLRALVSEHRVGDALAGRTALQALLGRVVVMALRDCEADVDDYVAALWCRIGSYPLSTRPDRIAANLVLDALKLVKKESRWASSNIHVDMLAPGELLDHVQELAHSRHTADHNADVATLTAAGVITAAGRLGLINGTTRAVLLSVYSDGLSGRDAAARHETSPAMIRYRCSHAVRQLARHAAQLAEAA